MATEHWFRWFHGTVSDPKWKVVALRASHALSRPVTVGHVVAVWAALLECASQATPRGSVTGFVDEDTAACLDVSEEEVRAIREAMAGKTHDQGRLTAWAVRQPAREDRTAAQRKRDQRERDWSGPEHQRVPSSHAASRNVTPEERRAEKSRKSHQQEPCASPHGTRLPADWTLPDEWRAWAQAERPDLDVLREAAMFADYWQSVPGVKGRKANWLATWRNWIRKADTLRARRPSVHGDVFAGAQ